MDMLKMIFILSVSGSALAVFLMLLTRLFGKELPSAFAYYAWLIVLFRFLLPIPGQLSFSFLSDQVNVQSASVSAAEEADAGSSFTIARPRAGMPVITLPELAERDIHYGLYVCDGIYNMDLSEASTCAKTVNARHSIPYHMAPGKLFDRSRAEAFDGPGKIIVSPGEEITLE